MQRVLFCLLENDNELRQTIEELKAVGGRWEWILNYSSNQKRLTSFLSDHSFKISNKLTRMALDRSQIKPLHVQPTFEYKRVDTIESLKDWISIASNVYPFINEQKELYFQSFASNMHTSFLKLYIGCVDQKHSATTPLFQQGEICGIYLVSTLEEERRKGLARNLLFYLITHEIDPNHLVVLQSTEMGKRVYESLGFQSYGEMGIYQKNFLGKKNKLKNNPFNQDYF